MRSISFLLLASLSALSTMVAVGHAAPAPRAAPPRAMDLETARRSARLQADFFREALLELHVTYVTSNNQPASALMIRKLFARMKEQGWPEARWMATNGRPLNPENVPRDAFEIRARRALRGGESFVETVEGRRYRAVAAVPFTGPCLKCHWGDKPSDFQGAVSFAIALSPSKAKDAKNAVRK